jgi:ethanolamine utilization protein EutP (predicted NTPase)
MKHCLLNQLHSFVLVCYYTLNYLALSSCLPFISLVSQSIDARPCRSAMLTACDEWLSICVTTMLKFAADEDSELSRRFLDRIGITFILYIHHATLQQFE